MHHFPSFDVSCPFEHSPEVNNEVNAASVNEISIEQDGDGLQNAEVDATANTEVHNTVNAASVNEISIND